MSETHFRFKQFEVSQEQCAMKINTDGVLLGAWVDVAGKKKILDVGTGSGVIAMMLAQRSDAEHIVGVEIDDDSYVEAKENMSLCEWKDHLEAVHASVQDYSNNCDEEFDLIVSNPPFFSGGTLSATQEKTDVRHTTKLSHNDLLRAAYDLLSKDGDFAVVLPHLEGLRFVELAEQYRFYCSQITEVNSFPEKPIARLLLNFKKKSSTLVKSNLSIRTTQDQYSDEYIALTKDFYLKM
ncbi:tRNA1(Val) (adenine(37)-N6)-methyltransferase [Portibacter lacus]|uniref:tRNA1(Val) (adenine(37)-N6)-methyltransferase n=1 Tax=Portibacter lacus TaxID=1099794 RepID=A0AA37SIU6_9BACT|nr:methyltransferase [Portibacter lacus]GLR15443.1 tRNA1(Val) (adenine(37)-N6)-methyltransferase [Portibacter lacus]